MGFKDMPWQARFQKLGDEAEGVFEEVWPTSWERFGLNRPALRMSMIPERIRHMPDYAASAGLIEVKGVGRDATIKLKVSEFQCASWWHGEFDLTYFVWDSSKKRWGHCPWPVIRQYVCDGRAKYEMFPEGVAYFAIKADEVIDNWAARHVPP